MIKKTKYRLLTKPESDRAVIDIMDKLFADIPTTSSAKDRFEKGWGENLRSGSIMPGYFGKHPINRLNGKFVMGLDKHFEINQLYSIIDELTYRYLYNVDTVMEFGCGTGHNLERIKDSFPDKRYIGLDFTKSSQKILHSLGMEGYNFNFFEPDLSRKIPKNTAVLTVAALEQTYTRFEQFLKYLIKQKPEIVVHIEPIPELLDKTNLLDYLSIKYMEKRKYLTGYLDTLKHLEKCGKIKILESRRSGIGSFLIDGYSVIVWKPL